MVPPLYVHIVEAHELIHNDVRPGTSVIDVPYNVQIVNGQVLNQVAQGNDELVRRIILNDGMYDFVIVQFLVIVVVVHVKQLVNDVGKFLRHLFADLGAGVLGGHLLAALYQAVDGDFLPILGVVPLLHHTGQVPLRIINQVGQLYLLLLRNQVAECLLDFLPGDTGRRPQQVYERLILPVQVAEKVFCSLRKAANRCQIDNFAGGFLNCGVFFCQELKICQIPHHHIPPIPIAFYLKL